MSSGPGCAPPLSAGCPVDTGRPSPRRASSPGCSSRRHGSNSTAVTLQLSGTPCCGFWPADTPYLVNNLVNDYAAANSERPSTSTDSLVISNLDSTAPTTCICTALWGRSVGTSAIPLAIAHRRKRPSPSAPSQRRLLCSAWPPARLLCAGASQRQSQPADASLAERLAPFELRHSPRGVRLWGSCADFDGAACSWFGLDVLESRCANPTRELSEREGVVDDRVTAQRDVVLRLDR